MLPLSFGYLCHITNSNQWEKLDFFELERMSYSYLVYLAGEVHGKRYAGLISNVTQLEI